MDVKEHVRDVGQVLDTHRLQCMAEVLPVRSGHDRDGHARFYLVAYRFNLCEVALIPRRLACL